MTTSSSLRVGILGCAGIAFKTATAILQDGSNCQVTAVASRSSEKAETFVKEIYGSGDNHKIQIFAGSSGYDDLIQSNDVVDALYIPLPTTLHKEWVLKALRAGKHVVVEKPVALNATDYKEILEVAYQQNKYILDGTMFPHHLRSKNILKSVADGTLGDVDRVESSFTFMTDAAFQDTNIRARKDGDALGAIGDLGWYCVRFAQMVFTEELGKKPVSAQVVDFDLTKHGVPFDATCVVKFEDGKVAWFHCGFKTAYRQRFEICGSQKSIIVDDLVLPVQGPVKHTLRSSGLTNFALLTTHETEEVVCPECPVHEVALWSSFATAAKNLDATSDDASKWTSSDDTVEKMANHFGSASLQNQQIVDALIQSLENGCISVAI